MADIAELLFFDTFAHENSEELNLDLVQFPKPVYVTEVRIIPLGARVQADFPGGVRLGATNPSQFQIEFFVNDLGKPGASSFETLGGFEYNQNGCINLVCISDDNVRKIPTDGLVLRGWYTTITLAVYGTLTANITEQIIPAVATPAIPAQPNIISDVQQISIKNEWSESLQQVKIEFPPQQQQQAQPQQQPPPPPQQPQPPPQPIQYPQQYAQTETYGQDYGEYYGEAPKDPRSYHHTPETDWDSSKPQRRSLEGDRDRDRDRGRERDGQTYPVSLKKKSEDHDHNERRSDKRYSRSHSQDRSARDKDHDRDWDHEYRDHDSKDWDRERDRDRDRYKHGDSYRRYSEREERKRPRTPPPLPVHSPKRPHTPQSDHKESPPKEITAIISGEEDNEKVKQEKKEDKQLIEEVTTMDVEEFEPILSDEDILDDPDNFQDVDYDYSGYINNDDLIKLFIPGNTVLQKYEVEESYKIDDKKLIIEEELQNAIAIADDFFTSSITRYTPRDFVNLNTEIKEEFIHLCEKVPQILSEDNFVAIARIHSKLKTVQNKCIDYIIDTLLNWLKIAMDFNMANAQDQPAYKIRHVKCGVKLAEWCSESTDFVKLLWTQKFYIHEILLSLYEREYMALSIKLMILKALDTYLQKKPCIEMFLLGKQELKENGYHDLVPFSDGSGYKMLVEIIAKCPSARLKFALNSILKKLNLFEALHKVQLIVMKMCNDGKYSITVDELTFISQTFHYVLELCSAGPFILSQPRRFLPVAAQFEINRSETKDILVKLFSMQNLLEVLLVLLASPNPAVLENLKVPAYELLSELTHSLDGMKYFASNCETSNAIVKVLLRNEDEVFNFDTSEIKSHNLGLCIAYKLQCLYHIECLLNVGKRFNNESDATEVIDQLHALFCLTFANVGKESCVDVLGMGNNMNCLLQFLDLTNYKSESSLMKLRSSPSVGYIVDLIAMVVIYSDNIELLEKHSKQILEIINQKDLFEPSTKFRLSELVPYLQPFVNFKTYDVSELIENINKHLGAVTLYSGSLITSLRILQHIGISKYVNKTDIVMDNPLSNFTELKYKHVILQMFPLDAMSLFGKIVQAVCDFYEQPSLHTSTFVSNQGALIIHTISPCIYLLSQMLTYAIQCQNTEFKDLTLIPILLRTYNLCQSFPASSYSYFKTTKLCKLIVNVMLVYTQPVSEEVHEKDSLNKTLWTKMCGEVIKYTMSAPYTFVAGLSVFSEILPLPLPMQTRKDLNASEITWAVNLRKLWSAHLHSHSSSVHELIARLCTTTHQPLLRLLRKICAQIADLAANSAVMIGRGILDNVHSAIVINDDTKKLVCNGYIARLMNFVACLVTHSSLKCTFLNLLSNLSGGKGDEKYPTIVQAFAQILRSTSNVPSHVQTQECILSIIQTFCDTEITLQQAPGNNQPTDEHLANSLPIKDLLIMFLNTVLEHVTTENSFITYLPVLRSLLLIAEYDFGFYYLREVLLRRTAPFTLLFAKLIGNFVKDNADYLTTLTTFIEFLRICVEAETVESGDSTYRPRTMKMTLADLQTILVYKTKEDGEHPLKTLEDKIKAIALEDATFETLLESIQSVIKMMAADTSKETKEANTEPVLPAPDLLLVQFAGRPMFTSTDVVDERLATSYWRNSANEDAEGDFEPVTVDLADICRQDLSPEVNLIKQIEKLCRVCSSESTEQVEKEKRLNAQKDKMKRPFVHPVRGRGFARTLQVRSDLFRSRPPNTSRPPSLHVDDFVALETCGAQPTGPTGYNKISRELLATTRVTRGTRGRTFAASERAVQYRQLSWWSPGLGRAPY